MANIGKGVVTQLAGGLPVVQPYGIKGAVTPPLVNAVDAIVGDVVAYVVFGDGTGVVLAKM